MEWICNFRTWIAGLLLALLEAAKSLFERSMKDKLSNTFQSYH